MIRRLSACLALIFCLQVAAEPALRAAGAPETRKLTADCDTGCDDDKNEIYETTWGIAALSLLATMVTSFCIGGICMSKCTWDGPNCNAQKVGKGFVWFGGLAFAATIFTAAVHYLEYEEA